MSIPKVGDIGTIFELDTLFDVSGIVSSRIDFSKPDQTTTSLPGIQLGPAFPTVIFATTPPGFWDIGGLWTAQAYVVVVPGTQEYAGDAVDFSVGRLII